MTLLELQREGTKALAAQCGDYAANDAGILLRACCGMETSGYFQRRNEEASQEIAEQYRSYVARRAEGEPLQYILGTAYIEGLEFHVTPDVLIPRFDTEFLIEEAKTVVRPGMRVLDLCTGSGCVLLTMLASVPNVIGIGCDLSQDALLVAQENARRLAVSAAFYQGDLFAALPDREPFDVITCNPPYIKSEEIETLDKEVKDYEPRLALDGGMDGLIFYRRIIPEAKQYLVPGGALLFEVGFGESGAVEEMLTEEAYTDVRTIPDFQGIGRVVMGIKE